ncbi:hypothetical protein A0H81_14740 [Grifola frondosa]|uniref:Uncharacterized protein n=1 Tax=Grifola frondosa TaxID=5627 RepID=A0A1C7LKM2_GRIFR|nr:hypothetical protein A0H81_14740 [Grifola frondosa]
MKFAFNHPSFCYCAALQIWSAKCRLGGSQQGRLFLRASTQSQTPGYSLADSPEGRRRNQYSDLTDVLGKTTMASAVNFKVVFFVLRKTILDGCLSGDVIPKNLEIHLPGVRAIITLFFGSIFSGQSVYLRIVYKNHLDTPLPPGITIACYVFACGDHSVVSLMRDDPLHSDSDESVSEISDSEWEMPELSESSRGNLMWEEVSSKTHAKLSTDSSSIPLTSNKMDMLSDNNTSGPTDEESTGSGDAQFIHNPSLLPPDN